MTSAAPDAPPLALALRTHPLVADAGRAKWRLADLAGAMDLAGWEARGARHVQPLLAAIADHSPFLWQLIEADPARTAAILEADPAAHLADILSSLDDLPGDEAEVMRRLRRARQAVALTVALADLGGAWSGEEVLAALSRAADAFIAAALDALFHRAEAEGRLAEAGARRGLVVLALGKLGGCELNYSSDVDLVILFDPQRLPLRDRDEAKPFAARLARDLVRLLQQPTADGHVARVDLRLRPEPGASAIAVSVEAAQLYYERFGQTWERAAWIKARPVAGDRELGARVLADLAPFVWRRYLDFAAIADIHAMKRKIHAAKGNAAVAVAGHDLKLGRGGIRDIEFFVQAQQLIFGGRDPALRGNRTLAMLRQLRREDRISRNAADDLARAYDFLRRAEHRLQMLGDAQTHTLPEAPQALARFARFCGFAAPARFSETLERHLLLVQHHYALLFERSADDGTEPGGGLTFAGLDDDPARTRLLGQLGFGAASQVAATVRAWHDGSRPATRSPRARERLAELTPKLLATFAQTCDPDAAVAGFDRVLERLPAAGELFAILSASAPLRMLFADVLGSAPRLADAVAAQPHLLDTAIDPEVAICGDEDEMTARIAQVAVTAGESAGGIEALLDALRDYQHEEHFLIGVRLLSGACTPDEAADAYTALAVGVVRAALAAAIHGFSADHGTPRGAELCLLGMGKLGSREMSAQSDLDLILVYDFDPNHPESDGARPLHATAYFARLTQRLVSYLTVPTRRGRLYAVDMRLRPSGNQGPLATKFSGFSAYQRTTAETWEHMALTRARPVGGDPALCARVAAEIGAVLAAPAGPALAADVAAMRRRIAQAKPPAGPWDLKYLPGGLVDIEFLAQYLALSDPALAAARPATRAILVAAGARGALTPEDAAATVAAHRLVTAAQQILRLALADDRGIDTVGRGLKLRLAEAAGGGSFAKLQAALGDARGAARAVFERVVGAAEGR